MQPVPSGKDGGSTDYAVVPPGGGSGSTDHAAGAAGEGWRVNRQCLKCVVTLTLTYTVQVDESDLHI